MKPVAFEYCRPDTLAEAVQLLQTFGAEASLLSGGMSLGAMLNMRLVRPTALIDLKRVQGLDTIEYHTQAVRTGATLRQADALNDAKLMASLPLLALALPWVGHYQTRNRGTLGGSVAHADPSSEIPLVLLTLGGEVELQSARGVRRVAAQDFFLDILTTARAPDELISALHWPIASTQCGNGFGEIAQRHGDFAIVACAAQVQLSADGLLTALRVGLGGVESRPVLADVSRFIGQRADAQLAQHIAHAAAQACSPMSDIKASADYRRALVQTLGAQVIQQAFQSVGGR